MAVLCDSIGRFRLVGARGQPTTFEVRRLGYAPKRFTVVVLGDSTQVAIELLPLPTVLEPIGVTAPGERGLDPSLVEHGFYRRLRAGIASNFVTPEELERLKPEQITDVLRVRPGIRVTSGGEPGNRQVQVVWGRNFCLLNVFVDGIEVAGIYGLDPGARRGGVSFYGALNWQQANPQPEKRIGGLGIDDFVRPSDVAAVEIYASGASTPIEFRSFNECGAIVIWTKIPRPGALPDGSPP